jgi:hypothetical protein
VGTATPGNVLTLADESAGLRTPTPSLLGNGGGDGPSWRQLEFDFRTRQSTVHRLVSAALFTRRRRRLPPAAAVEAAPATVVAGEEMADEPVAPPYLWISLRDGKRVGSNVLISKIFTFF